MKKLLIIITAMALALQLYAQEVKIGDYVGIWRYEDTETNSVFTVQLKQSVEIKYIKGDCIMGTYSYYKGGKKITDNISKLNSIQNPLRAPIFAYDPRRIYNSLDVLFTDELYNDKSSFACSLTMIITDGEKNKLHWVLKEEEGDYILFEGEVWIDGFSVPTDLILTKVEN